MAGRAAPNHTIHDAAERSVEASPFLRRLVTRYPDLIVLATDNLDDAVAQAGRIDEPIAAGLRIARARLMLVVALADLAGAWPLERVVETLSDFADRALDVAIGEAMHAHVLGTEPQGLAVIALGKHGSRELNFSSDIDPIFIYDPDVIPRRAREEPGEAAVRIVRRVVDLLQARDGDGYVFRVDLRLRPASEATPIALPIDAAISHYESHALPWERAAFIRGRAAAGDRDLGTRFLSVIEPFVWRRSLDFGAIGDLQRLTRSIRAAHGRHAFGPGFDLKRGRGGIREIEFFAQIHQLIHGGRDRSLRPGATLDALSALATAGRIDPADAVQLAAAYRRFRTIEHRLQMVDDRQTHSLPEDPAALDAVARLDGLADGAALLDDLRPHVAFVGRRYDALDAEGRGGDAGDDPSTAPAHDVFVGTGAAARLIGQWRAGGVRSIRSPAAVAAFEALLPDLLADFARAPDPDAAIASFDRLLGKLSSGVNLFRLLNAQPAVRALLVDILSHAPALADALALHPSLIDRLLDRSALDPIPAVDVVAAGLAGRGSDDLEAVLDRVRCEVGEARFALGTQVVAAAADPTAVAAGYGRVAEAAIRVVTARVVAEFERAHGRVPGAEFVIIALGRMGGGLLTHASDLDLVYLFTGDFATESDGGRPLGATQYFNRLGQRVSAALSVPTAAGGLYEIDTRLRPSGAQGPLVSSVDSFIRYQGESAWTWEHMALTRARPVFGSQAARTEVSRAIAATLATSRDRAALVADVVKMRRDIAVHKPPKGPLDVKLQMGGLVDLEFVVHFHQLANRTGFDPDLRGAILELVDQGLVDRALLDAHDLLTRLLVTLRLVSPELEVPGGASRDLIARAGGAGTWDMLLDQVATARQCVTRHWDAVQRLAED